MSNTVSNSPPGPNPWLDWPCPSSLAQPNLQITLTKFFCHVPQTGTYPYRLATDPGSVSQAIIYFYEMRGSGPPPRDVGYPGDVYIDISLGAHALWSAQMTNNGKWTRWTPQERIKHPHLPFRYLWCSTQGEVSWYSPIVYEALLKHENPEANRKAGDLVAEMLRADALRSKRKEEDRADHPQSKRQKLGGTLDTSGGSALEYIREKSPYMAYTILSAMAPRENVSAALISPSTPGSETTLHDDILTTNLSKQKFGDAHHLSAEVAQYQHDINSQIEVIAKLHKSSVQCQSALTVTNACQLLSGASEKLSQRIYELLARQEALTVASFSPETHTESSGKKPSNCPERNQSVDSDLPGSRSTSKAVIPSTSASGTSFDKIVASFDDILYDLLKAEQSKKEAEKAHSAQMISMLQNKEEMRAELAVITEQRAILDMKIERMKRAVAEC